MVLFEEMLLGKPLKAITRGPPDMTTSYKTTGEVHTITHALRHHEPTQDYCPFNTLRPRQMDAISQTTFSNAFSWMKMFEFRLKFYWVYFLRFQLTIFQHWFRYWLGAVQATSHYLNQWSLVYWRIYASLGLNELTYLCDIWVKFWMQYFWNRY